jgi:hypothetical protein
MIPVGALNVSGNGSLEEDEEEEELEEEPGVDEVGVEEEGFVEETPCESPVELESPAEVVEADE